MMDNKAIFKNLLLSTKREGIEDLLNYLEDTSIYTDPASTRYHSNYPGGLVEHSITVYKILKALCKLNRVEVGDDTLIIVSLLHDLVKVGSYNIETRNHKNAKTNYKWESYMTYVSKNDCQILPHGLQSAHIISRYIKLTDEEYAAITYHMGQQWAINECDNGAYNNAVKQYPIVLLMHHADAQASFIHEKIYDVTEIPFTNNLEIK